MNYPIDFPTQFLPRIMAEKIAYVSARTQTPQDLAALPALAVASAAVQYSVQFKKEDGGVSPVSLNLIALADSGERKSSATSHFLEAMRSYEMSANQHTVEGLQSWRSEIEIWNAEKRGLLAEISKNKKEGLPIDDLRLAITEIVKNKPVRPLEARLVYQDFTPNALVDSLAQCWPSGIIASDEASGLLQGRSFSDMSALNSLWGGDRTVRTRVKGHVTMKWPPRLTLFLQVQPGEFGRFMAKRGNIAQDIGFLARALICQPPSLMGTRFVGVREQYLVPPTAFDDRVRQLLEESAEKIQSGDFTQKTMALSVEARTIWVNFFNAVEAGIIPGGIYHSIRAFASKIAENAIRIAAVLEYFSTSSLEISCESIQAGINVANYFLMQHQRLFGAQCNYPVPDAEILFQHLLHRSGGRLDVFWERRYLIHRLPTMLRRHGRGRAALDILISQGRLLTWRREHDGQQMVAINYNPVTPTPAQWISEALLPPTS